MKIIVSCPKGDTTKSKGDLLEKLSKDLLLAQNYDVIEEIRFTGMELDLLCKHKVSGKEIYVECKAQKDKIGAPILRQLLGTVVACDYSEGWLVSTSEFGKDAKGFAEIWKSKPADQSEKLSFYQPELVVDSLKNASIIINQPLEVAEKFVEGKEYLGEWFLLISKFGRYWGVYTLEGGAPSGVLLFNAKTGKMIKDTSTIKNLETLDSDFTDYDISIGIEEDNFHETNSPSSVVSVVEVQIGDSWDDYRPARPEDFIGRDITQKAILKFLTNCIDRNSDTRIFAITGNSGLGKSSLIAKVRDRSRNKFYKNRTFTFAIDMRGAKSPSYISASLLKSLYLAQENGFGDKVDIQLTDPSAPLSSESITKYLESLERKGQVICLIFDQFEELYSKPELFGVFNAAKSLMLDVASFKGNFALGFAWKTDSTTQQDHPAYHMWHDLSDYRKMYRLDVFDKGEIANSITKFEKEIGKKVPIEIRHQISNSSQGFPWLIKKLCINLYENIKKGDGTDSFVLDLDVRRLFEHDLALLTPGELTCLKLIAQKAPADWSEILELSGVSTLNSLVHKRLVIKSGDRLNVYWDIFKDYLLTNQVPVIPFNYIPSSEILTMIKVMKTLNKTSYLDAENIAHSTNLKEKTVWNIGADLVMLGLAERKGMNFIIHRELGSSSNNDILDVLRCKLGKHSLKLILYKEKAGKVVSQAEIIQLLKLCLTKSKYSDTTWRTYTNKLINMFLQTGYLVRTGTKMVVQDTGAPRYEIEKYGRKGKRKGALFSATASPASVCDLLTLIKEESKLKKLNESGYRNSIAVLNRFDLIFIKEEDVELNEISIKKYGGLNEAVWTSCKNEPTVNVCIDFLDSNSRLTGPELGQLVSDKYGLKWTTASMQRNGNSLKQWANWVQQGIVESKVPVPPGRSKK